MTKNIVIKVPTRVITCVIFGKIACWVFDKDRYICIEILKYNKKELGSYLLETLDKNQKNILEREIEDFDLPSKEIPFIEWAIVDKKLTSFILKDQDIAIQIIEQNY